MADGLEPLSLTLVICDAIHVDPATGKRTLLGLFSAVLSVDFPAKVPAMAVHAVLTECRGTFPIALQVIDVNEEREPVARIDGTATAADPLMMLEIDFRLGNLEFPEPGEYRVQLLAAGALVSERRLALLRPPSMENQDE